MSPKEIAKVARKGILGAGRKTLGRIHKVTNPAGHMTQCAEELLAQEGPLEPREQTQVYGDHCGQKGSTTPPGMTRKRKQ